jgi:anti-sigma B factor antagonist
MYMTIEKTISDGTVVLAISGGLTAVTAEKLSIEVEQVIFEMKKLVFDFKDLDYLASAGLRVILNAKKKLDASGGELVIRNVTDTCMNVFEVTGLKDVLTFE